MDALEKYYNKFNEDKRLLSRHGQVEMFVALHYINQIINGRKNLKVLDVGAGTGRYSEILANQGHQLTAIDYVKKNVSQIRTKKTNIIAKQGTALDLKFKENQFDIVLLFGPIYHLFTKEDKLKALLEAKRVVKQGGHILVMHLTQDYAIITYAIKEGHLIECLNNGTLDNNFNIHTTIENLYSYSRVDEINELVELSNLSRHKIIGVDGPTDYIRPHINKLTEKEFEIYKQYVLSISERNEILGASSHILDILQKK